MDGAAGRGQKEDREEEDEGDDGEGHTGDGAYGEVEPEYFAGTLVLLLPQEAMTNNAVIAAPTTQNLFIYT